MLRNLKNIGYFPIARLYPNFNMSGEFKFLESKHNFQFDLESFYKFLLYSQIIISSSKKQEYENKDLFFENFNFSDDQMYDGINFIGQNNDYILKHIVYELKKFYKPQTSHTYFDGTNIYFEIDRENDF